MTHHNGRIPGFPYPPGGGGQGVQVASPLNDQQLICLMASGQLAGVPVPDDPGERHAQAANAVLRSLDVLGHTMYHMARGTIGSVCRQAITNGEAAGRAALEAEQSRGDSPPSPKEEPTEPRIVGPDGSAP